MAAKKKKFTADRQEPIWWGLFAGGGMVAAMLIPVHVLLFGILGPMGVLGEAFRSYEANAQLIGNPIIAVYFLVVIALPLFHWAHRFRFTLLDLGWTKWPEGTAVLCYGMAVLGAVAVVLVIGAVFVQHFTDWLASFDSSS